jgi:hypothetical protein
LQQGPSILLSSGLPGRHVRVGTTLALVGTTLALR